MSSSISISNMTNQEAVDKLYRAYRVKFDDDPDQMGQAIIELAAPRVASGEFFTWEEVSGFRKLQMHKESPTGDLKEIEGAADELLDQAEEEIEIKRVMALPPETAHARNITKRQQDFCRYLAAGTPQWRAYEMAGYGTTTRRASEVAGSRLIRRPTVAAYFRSLMQATWSKDFLSLAEKRNFNANVVRTPVGDLHEFHPLAQEVKRKTFTDKDGNTSEEVIIKMPSKLEAAKFDAQLAGELDDRAQINVGFNFKLLEGELEEAQVIDVTGSTSPENDESRLLPNQ